MTVGNSETFEKLIVEHQGLIHKVCHIYGKSEADREDLFQEITLQLWRSFDSFQNKAKFSTWLYRVALNTAITVMRKISRRPEGIALSTREYEIPDVPVDNKEEEAVQRLRWAIQQLRPVDRGIIFLYLEEKSYQEIAEITGITVKNVSVKLVRIKARLLDILTSSHGK